MRLNTYLMVWSLVGAGLALALILSALWLRHVAATQAEYEGVLETAQRILVLQTTGFRPAVAFDAHYFDWYPVTRVGRPAGSCLLLRADEDTTVRRACSGPPRALEYAPGWFVNVYQRYALGSMTLARDVGAGPLAAALELVPDPKVAASGAWAALSDAGAGVLLVVVCTSIAVSLAVQRALRPLRTIATALEHLGKGRRPPLPGRRGCREIVSLQESYQRLSGDLEQAEAVRTRLWNELLSVQEQEREALALELHDEFGQHLSVIRANAAGIRMSADDTEAAADAARIDHSARHLMELVRHRLRALGPCASGASFADGIRELASDLGAGERGRARVEVDLAAGLDDLPAPIATTAFRIVQESITNAVRHAAASWIRVTARERGAVVSITVSDDGGGCDLDPAARGIGMTGIVRRARALGGGAEFSLNDMGGLTVTATLPRSAAAERP